MNADQRSSFRLRLWPKRGKTSRLVLLAVIILLTLYLSQFKGSGPLISNAGVLVLEDCDTNYRTPPFHDAVTMFDPSGKPFREVSNLNICETIGGCRALSAAPDGRSFTICESVDRQITSYQLKTGKPLWSVAGEFTAATVSMNDMVYALTSAGTIEGKETLVIDRDGRIVRQAAVGGFDLAVDSARKVLWLVGKDIKKCDLGLNVLLETNLFKWCAVSVDLDRDGSVWVAERQHPDVAQSTNRILRISSTGQALKSVGLDFSPSCLRVDRSDGNVWVTGSESHPSAAKRLLDSIEKHTGRLPIGTWLRNFLTKPAFTFRTQKYDRNGIMLDKISYGGFTLDIDQSDGSMWIAGRESVRHYSRQGAALGQSDGMAPSQKYVAAIPANMH